MPQKLLCADILICDSILQEADGVSSVIRLVDLFTVRPAPDVPVEKQVFPIKALVTLKGQIGDSSEHNIRIEMIRPSGENQVLLEKAIPVASRFGPSIPGGATLVLHIGVIVREMGTHYIRLLDDGEELIKVPFTLKPPEPDSQEA